MQTGTGSAETLYAVCKTTAGLLNQKHFPKGYFKTSLSFSL